MTTMFGITYICKTNFLQNDFFLNKYIFTLTDSHFKDAFHHLNQTIQIGSRPQRYFSPFSLQPKYFNETTFSILLCVCKSFQTIYMCM